MLSNRFQDFLFFEYAGLELSRQFFAFYFDLIA